MGVVSASLVCQPSSGMHMGLDCWGAVCVTKDLGVEVSGGLGSSAASLPGPPSAASLAVGQGTFGSHFRRLCHPGACLTSALGPVVVKLAYGFARVLGASPSVPAELLCEDSGVLRVEVAMGLGAASLCSGLGPSARSTSPSRQILLGGSGTPASHFVTNLRGRVRTCTDQVFWGLGCDFASWTSEIRDFGLWGYTFAWFWRKMSISCALYIWRTSISCALYIFWCFYVFLGDFLSPPSCVYRTT